MIRSLTIRTPGRGLHAITDRVERIIDECGIREGLCTIFLRHTSAGLIIQENADPSARHDLETWLDRHVPDGDALYTHNDEGPDDMPAHIRAVLTGVHLSIPVMRGSLALGTWQGIYLWEHRTAPHDRTLVIHVSS